MKFAEHLSAHITPEWRKQYIQYEVANLQRNLEEVEEDNIKMTTILENVLTSHNKMQIALGKVQIELEHKDSEIAGLKKDRTQNEQRIQTLEEKLDMLAQCNAKMTSLCKALETSKLDKKKLIQNLEQTLQTNSALGRKLCLLQDELESKEAECQQLVQYRDQLTEVNKRETRFNADRLETLKKQFQTEREVAKKAAKYESYKEIELELRQMEKLKDLYQKKIYEQSLSIKQFATELTSKRQQLAKNQQVMENQRKKFEEECQTLENTIKKLKKCEEKLKEASIEISANLEEDHHWFKPKFDSLQQELLKNRKPKLGEESGE